MKMLYERVAGIDVHKDMIKVAIRSPGDKPGTRKTEVLEFRTFYGVLREVARELRRRGVTHVAMEASGVYTEPVYHALCEQDFAEVLVVNPAHVKALKGHKTDARDCRRLAAAADAAEDAAEGSNPRPVTPRALARRAERRERLARARDRLAAEDTGRRDAQRARQQAWDTAAAAGKPRGRRPGDEPRANRAGTEPRATITDPGVRVMRNQKGYVAGYNGQAVVTAGQVIAGAMVSQHPVDRTLLAPLLAQCRDQLDAAGIWPKLRTVLADAGYVSEENFARADQDKLRLLAPLAKDPGRPGGRPAQRARHLEEYPATARAIRRMRHHRGREDYKLRARTVEPVFGQLKACQNLTTMSRRGLDACQSEWLLACTAHNLRKLHRHRLQG